MAPVVGVVSPSRTIVISPTKMALLNASEQNNLTENVELPKYAVGLFESNGPGPRKRKRLTHLTPEEKIMRRKLKNRVAAQTARDRKKARLETLEETVAKIHEQTKKLLDVNSLLLERTEALEKENEILRKRLGLKGDCSFTENKRKELDEIQEEFNNTIMEQNLSASRVKNESSDDEYCVLTAYEPMGRNEVGSDETQCQASKCVSPVPAAGSCQLSKADPLASATLPIIDTDLAPTHGSTGPQGTTDLTLILGKLGENCGDVCSATCKSQEGDATGSSEDVASPGFSGNKLTVPLNIFRDHEYTKSEPCITWRNEDGPTTVHMDCAFKPATVQQELDSDSKKSTALFEGSEKNIPICALPAPSSKEIEMPSSNDPLHSSTLSELLQISEGETGELGNTKLFLPDTLVDTVSDGFETCFDELFSCGLNTSENSEMASDTSSDSGVSCESPLTCLLDTPSPLSDISDPFEGVGMGFWDEQWSTDLFPQLSTM